MAAVLAGEGVLVLLYPLLTSIGLMDGYTVLLLLYVLMANLHSLCGAMAQALGKIRLYAAGGILCTALVVLLNILLLAVFRMGITGYILSNIIADGVTALILFAALRLWRYLNPRALRRSLAGSMFRYCLPLIPATVCSWVINISDRYFISYLIGSDVSGQYAVAGKVSMALLTVSGIFTDAWQLSIASDRPREEKGRFFSNVLSVFEAGVLSAAAVLIAAAPLIIRLLAVPDYFTAWHYVPLLVLGAAAASLGSFFLIGLYFRDADFGHLYVDLSRRGGEPCGERPPDPPLGGDGGGGGDAFKLPSHPHLPGGPFPPAAPLPLERLAVYSRDGGAAGRVPADGDGAVCRGGRLLHHCPPIVLPPDGQGAEKRRFGSGADKTAGVNCAPKPAAGPKRFACRAGPAGTAPGRQPLAPGGETGAESFF